MSAAPLPEWAIPPEGGFTAADLDRLPDLPPRDPATEAYVRTGIHREQLKVTAPFGIEIDLTEIDKL
jgi:hypothetical protein